MGRPIKFRVWHEESKTWKITDLCLYFINKIAEFWLSNGYIIEQYTGLKDKNDKEIYEGDIVKIVSEPFFEPTVGIVGFDENRGVYDSYTIENNKVYWDTGNDFCSLMGREDFTTEVIGTIHENPELLGDKE